jgi:hypothetical protein
LISIWCIYNYTKRGSSPRTWIPTSIASSTNWWIRASRTGREWWYSTTTTTRNHITQTIWIRSSELNGNSIYLTGHINSIIHSNNHFISVSKAFTYSSTSASGRKSLMFT